MGRIVYPSIQASDEALEHVGGCRYRLSRNPTGKVQGILKKESAVCRDVGLGVALLLVPLVGQSKRKLRRGRKADVPVKRCAFCAVAIQIKNDLVATHPCQD